MSYAHTQPVGVGNGIARRAIKTVSIRLRQYFARRHAMQTLSSLNDRALKDIGVSRSEIPGLAQRASQQIHL